MDGPQDLGGKEDFGPIDTQSPEFREEWEKRQWALSKLVGVPGTTIDWFRHALETMPPAVYLSVPYFQKWNANDMALAIDAGVYTVEECVSGRANTPGTAPEPRSVDDCEALQRSMNVNYLRDTDTRPAFQVSDTVRTAARPATGHTRLPAYARAATGTVTAHHGAHLYADDGARGVHTPHHLYTVEFNATDLWSDATTGDTVRLDLWEPYLARP